MEQRGKVGVLVGGWSREGGEGRVGGGVMRWHFMGGYSSAGGGRKGREKKGRFFMERGRGRGSVGGGERGGERDTTKIFDCRKVERKGVVT